MTTRYCELDLNEKIIFVEWMVCNESWIFPRLNNMNQLFQFIDKLILEDGIANLAIELISIDLFQFGILIHQ